MSNKIPGYTIAQNMLKYVEIQTAHEAFLDALFGLQMAEKDIQTLEKNVGPTPEIDELTAKALELREYILERAANATPKSIDYGDNSETDSQSSSH